MKNVQYNTKKRFVDLMHYYRFGAVALKISATAPFCLQSSHLYYIGGDFKKYSQMFI